MIPAINGVLFAVSGSPAASIVAKATAAIALGLSGAWLARRSRAAVRHALLAAAFGVLLLLPIASIVAPPVRIAVPAAAAEGIVPPFAAAADAIRPAAAAHPARSAAPAAPPPAGFRPSSLLLVGWIAGTTLFLLPVAMGLWQVRWLRRSARPWGAGQPVVERLARDSGIHRRIEVLLHEAIPGPMTCGVLHPAILLSPDAQTWEEEDLNRAIVHELEHARRGDWLSQCLARAVCAVYWFHPLVWIAWRQFALEAERSCDDAVLALSEATAYAGQLVGLAQRLSKATRSPLTAMANRADLAKRVGAVLDSRQRRGRAGTFPVVAACAAAALLVLTVSPLKMVAARQSASKDLEVVPMSQGRMIAAPQSARRGVPVVAMAQDQTVAAPQSAGKDTGRAPFPWFSTTVGLVIVPVFVADKSGKSVEGLNANDFAVTEDGVAQTISFVEFQKETLPLAQGTISSYYILGYYTGNPARGFRKIEVTGRNDIMAKLEYRAGYFTQSFDDTGHAGRFGTARQSGPDITFPVPIYKKLPEYSEEASKAKYSGTVALNFEVDASGQATNIKVVHSLGLGLDEKAIEAVSQWKFKPGTKDGKPVPVPAQAEVNFRLL